MKNHQFHYRCTVSTNLNSQGLAVNEYGLDVRAPTGHKSIFGKQPYNLVLHFMLPYQLHFLTALI